MALPLLRARPWRFAAAAIFLGLVAFAVPAVADRVKVFFDVARLQTDAREKMAARDYRGAAATLEQLVKDAEGRPEGIEALVLLGKARLAAGDLPKAIEAWDRIVRRHADSPWAEKARFLMADAYVGAKRMEDAAAIYRERAAFLTGDAYRGKIAGLYLELADKAYVGEKHGKEGDPLDPPRVVRDYARALDMYVRAEQVGVEPARRAEVTHRIAVSMQETGRVAEAAERWRTFLKEHADAKAAAEATYRLGLAEMALGRTREARVLFARVEEAFGDAPEAPLSVIALGASYRPGASGDKESLRQGTGIWRRFVDRYPDHDKAGETLVRLAEALRQGGELEAAIATFQEVTERWKGSDRAAEALYAIGGIRLARQEYEEARAAWGRFLSAFPNHPRFVEAQRAIVMALFQKGDDAANAAKHEAAETAYRAFLTEYPVDQLSPRAALGIGYALLHRDRKDDAIEAMKTCASKYAGSEEAPQAQQVAADTLAGKGALADAIQAYEHLIKTWPHTWHAQHARQRLAEMRERTLVVKSARAYATNEPLLLDVGTRNIDKIVYKAYRLDLLEYFRKKHRIDQVEQLAIDIVTPDKTLQHAVEAYEPYRLFDRKVPLELDEGAYVVVCEDERLRATALALRSDLAIVVKQAPRHLLVWAKDEKTGAPAAGVDVLASNGGSIVCEGKTDKQGIFIKAFDGWQGRLHVFAHRGKSFAFSSVEPLGAASWGYSTKTFLYTDRPVYRPGQRVFWKGIARRVVDGLYQASADQRVRVEVRDPRGLVLLQKDVETNEYGSISGDFLLGEEPPHGAYQVHATYQGSNFSSTFHVEAYVKPELVVEVKPERTDAIGGEEVLAKVEATYAFGGEVKDAQFSYQVWRKGYAFDKSRYEAFAWFFAADKEHAQVDESMELVTSGEGKLDANGKAEVRFATEQSEDDHVYTVSVSVLGPSRRWAAGGANVYATAKGFFAVVKADKKVYRPREDVRLTAFSVDAAHRGVKVDGEVVLYRRRAIEGALRDDPVERKKLAIGASGKAEVAIQVEEPGEYRATFQAKDRNGNLVEGGVPFMVAGEAEDLTKEAKLLFEREVYTRGEKAQLLVNAPKAPAWALITYEGEQVLGYNVVRLDKRSSTLEVDMVDGFSPNVFAEIAVPADHQLYRASDEVAVLKFLEVEVEPSARELAPGEKLKLAVKTLDHAGKPVAAEVSVAVVDEMVFAIRPDETPSIQPFFYDQKRTQAVRTESSFTWSYAGVTVAQAADVLAEQERRDFEQNERRKRSSEREMLAAGSRAAPGGPMPPPAMPAAAAPMEPMAEMKAEEADGAFGRLAMDRAEGAGGGGAMAPPTLRQRFADTAYWNAHVVTGKDGRGEVELVVPDNLTIWRVTARGATKDTLVGAAEASFKTRKPVVVQLALPRFLTGRDEVEIGILGQNLTGEDLEGRLELKLGALETKEPTTVAVKLPKGELRRHEPRVKAPEYADTRVRADLLTPKASDAIELPLLVKAFGERVRVARSGRLADGPNRFAFEVPADAIPGTASIQLALTPGLASAIVDALGYLDTYPYGCVEQTVNRFLPLVSAAGALRKAGAEVGRGDIEAGVARGVQRLLHMQRNDGGWGWWAEGASAPETTALALEGLELAREAGFFIDPNALERGRQAAVRLLRSVPDGADVRAELLRALALPKRAEDAELSRAIRASDAMSTIGQASLAIACARAERKDMGVRLAERLRESVKRDPDGAYWSGAEGRSWGASPIEATGRAVQALLLYDPTSALVDDGARWLLNRRQGSAWSSTKDTGAAVAALAGYLGDRGAARLDLTVVVQLDGREVARTELKGGASAHDLKRRLVIGAGDLPAGKHALTIERRGSGDLDHTVVGQVMVRRDTIEAKGNLLSVERRTVRWLPPEPARDQHGRPREPGFTILEPAARPGWKEEAALAEVASGERVVVHVAVTAHEDLTYLVIEDPLPAGLEAESERDPRLAGAHAMRFEARDDKAVFFCERLPKGTHLFSYTARAVRQGSFRALPAEATGMYDPEVYGRSASGALVVTKGALKPRAPTPDEVYAKALDLCDEKAWAAAKPLIEELLQLKLIREIRHELLVRLIDVRLALKDGKGAVAAYEELRDLNPPLARETTKRLEVAMGLIEAYTGIADFDGALALAGALVRDRFELDVQVAEVYRALGQEIPAQDYLAGLVRRYPDQGYVIDRWYQVARRYYDLDRPADPKASGPKHFQPDPRHTKMHMEAFRALKEFLAFHPESPWCDDGQYQAGLALMQLTQYDFAAIELAKVGERYPKSELVDDALHQETLAWYEQASYDKALEVGKRLIDWREVLSNGSRRESPHVYEVKHIFAKVHHLRGQLDDAVKFYKQVEGRYPDARDALAFLTERGVNVPRVVSAAPGKVSVPVRFKNLGTLKAKLYPVDLLLLFAKEKDLAKVAAVDLTGIAPRETHEVGLKGKAYEWNQQSVELPVSAKGAYLVVAKADDLDASTLVILSDLELKIQPLGGRTRVYATSRSTGKPIEKAYVTVADGARILARGHTDARGMFEAAGGGSQLSVVAEKDGNYALYRQGLTDR